MKRHSALAALTLMMIIPLAVHAQSTLVLAPEASGDRQRAIGCLATAIAYEAGYESVEGQQAVAEVILNRLRHPGYPKSICGVVFSGSTRRTGCQFSFTCDGSLNRRLSASVVTNTRQVAMAALDGLNPVRVPGATHYHADYVSPYWAPSLTRVTKIGAHIFYRGAGARDQNNQMPVYTTVSEPTMPGLETPGAAEAASDLTAKALVQVPNLDPVAFAPWGLRQDR